MIHLIQRGLIQRAMIHMIHLIPVTQLLILGAPRCYTGFRVSGDGLEQDSQTITQCGVGFVCVGFTTTAEINTPDGVIRGNLQF